MRDSLLKFALYTLNMEAGMCVSGTWTDLTGPVPNCTLADFVWVHTGSAEVHIDGI